MSSIKNLEMAAALSAYPYITIKKSLFSTKAIYSPTQSKIKVVILEYSPTEGVRVERLLSMPLDKMAEDISQNGKPSTGALGNFRLELCLSDDHQFCALQLFRFVDFLYHPVFEPRFYKDKDVETIALLV
jgi:hypothetical protein